MPSEIGTVICTFDGPSSTEFSFVVTNSEKDIPVKKGQFVELETEEGKMVAQVQDLMKTNRYFMRAESVKEYERGSESIASVFPADRWEYIVARARASGIQTENGMKQVSFPASPGQKVFEAGSGTLTGFLGIDTNDGVELGQLQHHNLPSKLNLTKLLRKHVAILAMSGAGKCLSYDIPVFLANGDLKPIGELVDSAFEKTQKKESEDGIEYVDQNFEDLEVLTLTPEMRIEKARIAAFMRRKCDDELLKIKTRSGKELRLTPDHPLLTINNGKLCWKSAGALRVGQKIAAPRRVKIQGEPQNVDLAEHFRESSNLWAHDMKEELRSIIRKIISKGGTIKELAERFDLSYNGFRHRLKSGNLPLKHLNFLAKLADRSAAPDVKNVGLKRAKPISSKIIVDDDFARFLAYLFAEGHNNGEVLQFANSTPQFLNDFIHLSEKIIGKKPFVVERENSKKCVVFSKSAAFVMEKVFQIKKKASEKRIPRIILRSPRSVVREFLRTLFDCDGYCSNRRTTISITFSNPINASRVEALLLRFGITSSTEKKMRKVGRNHRSYWYLYIEGVTNLSRFHECIGFTLPKKANRLKEHLTRYPNSNLDLISGVGGESELQRVGREISRLEKLATSHIFWDEVVQVERLNCDEHVYDLSIDGPHNFIASNLIVHNSHSAAVLVEELLDRAEEDGRIASVIVDVHGEYTSLAKPSERADYSDRASLVKSKNVQIGVPDMSAYQFREFAPDMSGSQVRELDRVIRHLRSEMRSGKGPYGLEDVISEVEKDGETKKQTRRALADRLYDLKNLNIFGKNDYPNWRKLAQPGKVAILDFSDMLNLRKKRIILTYFARKLFNMRKSGRAPPFALFLEEAHQFAPSKSSAISKSVLKTLAREGRKFYSSLILISQRPVRLSTTVLSQANTHIILRVTNPYDLDHIKKSSERITKDTIDIISSLPVGQALVVGEAVNHPIFVKVRERRSEETDHGTSLKEVARSFEKRRNQERKDAEAFM